MRRKESKSFLAISFSQGFVSPNIPIATFSQGETELNFILDTGSDRNVIDSSVLPLVEHTILDNSEDTMILTGVGGTQKVQLCTVSFQYDGKELTTEFLITDLKEAFTSIRKAHAIPIHGMLGARFFKENGIVMDFENMVAYNKEG